MPAAGIAGKKVGRKCHNLPAAVLVDIRDQIALPQKAGDQTLVPVQGQFVRIGTVKLVKA